MSGRGLPDGRARLSIFTTCRVSELVRVASGRTNTSLSQVVGWCVERGVAEYVRAHPLDPLRVRIGRRPRPRP